MQRIGHGLINVTFRLSLLLGNVHTEHPVECIVECELYSPNFMTIVSAIFRWSSSGFPRSNFGEPPNIVVWIRPECTWREVILCPNLALVPSGRVSWEERRQLTDGCRFINYNAWCLFYGKTYYLRQMWHQDHRNQQLGLKLRFNYE